jgi:putative ABC transport system permease protein
MRALDSNLPAEPATLDQHLGLAVLPQRLGAAVLGSFGVVSIALATLGLFGVMSYAVSQRSTEIGIRLAVGATGAHIIRLLVRDGMRLALAGVATGVAGAILASRLLASFLIGVSPTDPLTLTSIIALFLAAALLATWLPARRAASLDPMRVLRSE